MTKRLRSGNGFRWFAQFPLFVSIWKLIVSAIWKHLEAHCFRYLEAFGSSLFPLFGSIWKLTVSAVLHCSFWHWKYKKERKQWASGFFQNSELLDSSKTVSFHILPQQWASRFFQNSELPDSSKTVSFRILPKQWASRFFQSSANSFLVSITSSYLPLDPTALNPEP